MSKDSKFIINQYITLFLDNNSTLILINGKKFLQCKFLLIRNIHQDELEDTLYKISISSVDEQGERHNKFVGNNYFSQKFYISPEEEFWAHSSNLQVWSENNYDSRLLHRNLAFPLLRELVNAGDLIAKRVFKEEIAKRFESGYLPVTLYLLKEGYLDYLHDTYFKDLVISKLSFCREVLFNSIQSKKLEEGYLLSLYVFNKLYPFLPQKVISEFINTIKEEKNKVAKILFSPNMLTPAPKVYVKTNLLRNVRLELVLNMIRNRDFRTFNLNELELYDFLMDGLGYFKLKEEGELIRKRIQSGFGEY